MVEVIGVLIYATAVNRVLKVSVVPRADIGGIHCLVTLLCYVIIA